MFSSTKPFPAPALRGFSLFEVLISSAIIGIVTAIVVIKYSGFNNSVLLKNQAYEVALAIREAQVFSISSRSDQNLFRDPYGIYIDLSSSGSNQTITLFQDTGVSSGRYDGTDAVIDSLVVDSRFEITEICSTTSGGTNRCSSSTINQLSILFERPDFDASFIVALDGSTVAGAYVRATISLSTVGSGAVTRVVSVSSTGQIAVQ